MAEPIRFYDFFQKKNEETVTTDRAILELPVTDIKPNPNQPRKFFSNEALTELVNSIKEFGVMQPITVRLINSHSYELVCGERRLRAAKIAGLETIPAILVYTNDNKSALMAITENIQRQNLSFLEEALSYQSLVEDYGLTQEEIARKLGKSQSSIANKLRILRLNDNIKGLIAEYDLSERHARALLKIPDEKICEDVVRKVIENELTVKKTEELVAQTIEDIRDNTVFSRDQKIKRNLGDIRLITNTIKKSVEIMKNSGIDAVYNVEQDAQGYQIVIKIPSKNVL